MISDNGINSDTPVDLRPWVSVSDAAAATGRSTRQVRNWISEDRIRAERDERGDYWIHPDDVRIPPDRRYTRTPSNAARVPPRNSPVPVLAARQPDGDDANLMIGFEVTMLRSELAQAHAELAAVRAELASKETLLADRTAQLVAARAALRALSDVAADPTPYR